MCCSYCIILIKATKRVRLSNRLFVSYVTFKNVTTSTVARWLKTVLEFSGVDTSVFKAYSFRGASVSAAYNKEYSLKDILTTADWSSEKNSSSVVDYRLKICLFAMLFLILNNGLHYCCL